MNTVFYLKTSQSLNCCSEHLYQTLRSLSLQLLVLLSPFRTVALQFDQIIFFAQTLSQVSHSADYGIKIVNGLPTFLVSLADIFVNASYVEVDFADFLLILNQFFLIYCLHFSDFFD